MNNVNEQISRMKAMMTYGLQTENKNHSYSGIEYQKLGADGKTYGIVREGSKFYIKVADKINNVLKEDFNYIGGFCNRKNNEYSSYANALKNFEMKMSSLNEANGNKEPLIESWNPDKKEFLAVESTNKMKKEIARQKQIMSNTAIIQEKKNYSHDLTTDGCATKECEASQKNNIKKVTSSTGEQKGNGGDPFTKKSKLATKNNIKQSFKPVTESDEVLSWNNNKDYLDTASSTEIGDSAPFSEKKCCDTVDEGTSMHDSDNQNIPEVGVGKRGDDSPFTKKAIKEEDEIDADADDDFDSDVDDTDYDSDDDFDSDVDDTDYDSDDDFDSDVDIDTDYDSDDDSDVEDTDSSIEERLDTIEDLINKIADKLDVDIFDDDKLYDDDSDDEYDDTNADYDESDDDDEYEVFESKNFRKKIMEDKLNYFGQHPAYRKKPVKLPSSNHQEMQDYYDMNDDSVKGEKPYGEKIGSGDPFEVDVESLENAITESITRLMKKKI